MTRSQCRDLLVIVASAGGVSVLQKLLAELPRSLPASVLVLLHLSESSGGALPRVLGRSSALPVEFARDGDRLEHGRVLVAPPGNHLLVDGSGVRLSRGPRQNGHRPAADPLLGSAALAAGPRAVAVVLTGTLDDGARGSAAVARQGGLVLVQDPAEALYASMPNAAIAAVPEARIAPLRDLTALLAEEMGRPAGEGRPVPDPETERTIRLLLNPDAEPDPYAKNGRFVGVGCPSCGGPIFAEREDEEPPRYECLVGHAWTARSLLQGQGNDLEFALELATRQLEERMRLTRRLADRAANRGHRMSAASFGNASDEALHAVRVLRELMRAMPDSWELGKAGSETGSASRP
jgi:two-component system chemotaxis response regulator CheB